MRAFMMALVACGVSVGTVAAEERDKSDKLVSSNKILGAYIYDAQEEAIADVNTVVLNQEGKPMFVIAGVGGVAGIAESEVAIPWKALDCQCKTENEETTCKASISMTQEKLSKAPTLDAADYAELRDMAWLKKNAKYFSAEAPEEPLQKENLVCIRSVTDADISGTDGKSVGHLDALILNAADGQVRYAIIGDGGTVGVGEEYVAVPFKQLTFKHGEDDEVKVSINASHQDVKTAPRVTPSEYPELDLESVRNRLDERNEEQL